MDKKLLSEKLTPFSDRVKRKKWITRKYVKREFTGEKPTLPKPKTDRLDISMDTRIRIQKRLSM